MATDSSEGSDRASLSLDDGALANPNRNPNPNPNPNPNLNPNQVVSAGVSGWSELESARVRTRVHHAGEWIACQAPAAAAASAEVAVRLQS